MVLNIDDKFIDGEFVNPLTEWVTHTNICISNVIICQMNKNVFPKKENLCANFIVRVWTLITGMVASFSLKIVAKINSVLCIWHGWMNFVFISIFISNIYTYIACSHSRSQIVKHGRSVFILIQSIHNYHHLCSIRSLFVCVCANGC